MGEKKQSLFDSFWFPSNKENSDEKSKNTKTDWGDLFQEASKTWKSVFPLVKPILSKFKK